MYEKAHLISDFRKKKSPRLGLEPTKWDKKWVFVCQSFSERTVRIILELLSFSDDFFPFLFGIWTFSPFSIWTFISFFYLEFYFPYPFWILFPFPFCFLNFISLLIFSIFSIFFLLFCCWFSFLKDFFLLFNSFHAFYSCYLPFNLVAV